MVVYGHRLEINFKQRNGRLWNKKGESVMTYIRVMSLRVEGKHPIKVRARPDTVVIDALKGYKLKVKQEGQPWRTLTVVSVKG